MVSLITILLLAIPVACVSWTVTHEALFEELNDYCTKKSKKSKSFFVRKFCYIFTCEYCFSHYVTILLLIFTHSQFLYTGALGYILAGFSIVWVANVYMSLFALLRIDLKKIRKEANVAE